MQDWVFSANNEKVYFLICNLDPESSGGYGILQNCIVFVQNLWDNTTVCHSVSITLFLQQVSRTIMKNFLCMLNVTSSGLNGYFREETTNTHMLSFKSEIQLWSLSWAKIHQGSLKYCMCSSIWKGLLSNKTLFLSSKSQLVLSSRKYHCFFWLIFLTVCRQKLRNWLADILKGPKIFIFIPFIWWQSDCRAI